MKTQERDWLIAQEVKRAGKSWGQGLTRYPFLLGPVHSWRGRAQSVFFNLCEKTGLCVPGTARTQDGPFVPVPFPPTPQP